MTERAQAMLADNIGLDLIGARIEDPPTELVFGICKPVGVEDQGVLCTLQELLKNEFGYTPIDIHLSDWLKRVSGFKGNLDDSDALLRTLTRSAAANELRRTTGLTDALARCGLYEIAKSRRQHLNTVEGSSPRIAYIVSSFRTREEVQLFRDVYGERFVLISLLSSNSTRESVLRKAMTDRNFSKKQKSQAVKELLGNGGDLQYSLSPLGELAAELGWSEQPGVGDRSYRQDVADTFPLADLFVVNTDDEARKRIERFLQVLHGHPFEVPDRDERGMAYAFISRNASTALARQVGAAIIAPTGELIATGFNEVPKPMGGVYGDLFRDPSSRFGTHPTAMGDARDHLQQGDVSDKIRNDIFTDLMRRLLTDPAWFVKVAKELKLMTDTSISVEKIKEIISIQYLASDASKLDDLVESMYGDSQLLRGAQFFDVIEYGRTVHAEMTAILSAARQGVSLGGCTLYVTTFPCHECTRHIIASGIGEVVFVEPYAKSKGQVLHPDALILEGTDSPSSIYYEPLEPWPSGKIRVLFRPFRGIAPRRHEALFTGRVRKYSRRMVERMKSDPNSEKPLPKAGDALEAPTDWSNEKLVPSVAGPGRDLSLRLLNSQIYEEATRMRALRSSMARTHLSLELSEILAFLDTEKGEEDPLYLLLKKSD